MVSSININNLSYDYMDSNYRFSFTDKDDRLSLKDAIYNPGSNDTVKFSNITLDDMNQELLNLENTQNKTALLLDFNSQPKEVKELFQKIANGKYGTFVKRNADAFILGRNFEKANSSGIFLEDLGTSVSKETGAQITDGTAEKVVMVDSFNTVFNQMGTKNKGDKMFTQFSQILSVFTNELKQAYFMSKGKIKEDADVYTYLKGALTDVQSYIEKGGELHFVKSSGKEVFSTALDMMISNLDSYISKSSSTSNRVTVKFQAIA
ncbi:MAG: hypothetical protein PHV30_09805 [Candidatus Margulisbacteria bacterium]|nr:hypothetical protein [Candidatus Margulisiibacteriota bacterium]